MMVNDKREEQDMIYPKELVLHPYKLARFNHDSLALSCEIVPKYRYEQDLFDFITSSPNNLLVDNMRVVLNYSGLSYQFIDICIRMILLAGETPAHKKMCIRIIANTTKPIDWLRIYDTLINIYTVDFAIKHIEYIPIDLVSGLLGYITKKKISHLDLSYVNICRDEIYMNVKATEEIVALLLFNTSYHADIVRTDIKSDFINNIPYKINIPKLAKFGK